jgi:hypothetical protein
MAQKRTEYLAALLACEDMNEGEVRQIRGVRD